ncbi:MAG: polysaccharide biosynthesis C-terminal domain-containing protein [Bacteroidia bacterium]|nr:polysaccharide biosynthesis C-terminal domain-containing protein [Bacteroidia bacterium]MBT8279469.1 polysaccharide biosynthesis C-terminal domain-containing protein [Bacteroidia bacterium]NND24945.1 virulence factor MviN [Flavobacteriaceae bacterium]NNK61294.1 virulence factor MviN [Flavobacteriaceae bacterium]NNL31737.1 virulence factor MviN [Flavobacteriaceae bacterium]
MNSKFDLRSFISKLLKNATITNVITVGITTLIVSGLGFFKEIVVADSFGLSELLDTFYIAILVPSFISGVFLGSFNSVFIPNYVTELKTGKNIGAFQSTSFLVTIAVSLLFLIFAVLFTDVYLETFFKGHTLQYYELVKKQFYYVAPCILFWGFSSLISGLLTIDNEFRYSSIANIFTPITIIICLVFYQDQLGDLVLAIGTLLGSISSFLFLIFIAFKRNIINLKRPDFASVNIRVLFKQIPAKLSSSLLSGINPLIDQYFSAQLIVGSIAALNYGIKIPAFAISIAGLALGNVLLPYFSKQVVDNREKTFRKLKTILKYLIIVSLIAAVILILLSSPIIWLVFERNAFTSADTTIVSKIQQMYILQIPSYISGLVMVKFLTSINKNNFMVLTSLISLIMNIVLNTILIELMGVYGLALATSLVSIINSVILYLYILKLNRSNV